MKRLVVTALLALITIFCLAGCDDRPAPAKAAEMADDYWEITGLNVGKWSELSNVFSREFGYEHGSEFREGVELAKYSKGWEPNDKVVVVDFTAYPTNLGKPEKDPRSARERVIVVHDGNPDYRLYITEAHLGSWSMHDLGHPNVGVYPEWAAYLQHK